MGSCFSSTTAAIASIPSPTAKVITLGGSLLEYSSPVTVSEVLGAESCSIFLCNSDMLFEGAYIRALDCNEFVELHQIYFLLPIARLGYPLTGSDMAALAVKASLALTSASNKIARRQTIQVVPVETIETRYGSGEQMNGSQRLIEERGVWISRKRRTTRSSWRKARCKSVPFEPKLGTIPEVPM